MKIQKIRNHAYHSSNFENNHENCMFMINKMILIKNTLWNHAICGWEVIMCIMLISIVISRFWVYEIMFNLKLWLMSIYFWNMMILDIYGLSIFMIITVALKKLMHVFINEKAC